MKQVGRAKTALFTLVSLALLCITSFLLAEALLAEVFRYPAILRYAPPNMLNNFRHIYMSRIRKIVQYMPGSSRYDPELFYTLKPGDFDFENAEYRVHFHVNSMGLRDAENRLTEPEAIAIGDSYTMGWGIEQDQAFSKLFEKGSGLRVLNAGQPGYGTAREVALLNRLDTSKLKLLIIEYSDDDWPENRTFFDHHDKLPIQDETAFENNKRQHQLETRYFLGKYCQLVFSAFWESFQRYRTPSGSSITESQAFLNVLLHATHKDLSGVQLIMFEVDPFAHNRSSFVRELRAEAAQKRYPEFIRKMKILDLSEELTPREYFVLDDHINALGHRRIADALLQNPTTMTR